MGIQKCESYDYQFRWKEIQKANFGGYNPRVCGECGTEHRITKLTSLLSKLIVGVIVAFTIFYVKSMAVPFAIGLALLLILLSIDLLRFPYYIKYKAIQNHK
ncbi:TIGR04104 family putative zinc finger protein [Neobacillus ginsengisoli]|uniref:CXXC-20-CXXC protein n=2 Tax=Neobacillus TaxID=2675232 RepID=A0ABT9Y434_9BACI|nr:TIGR04104 family putative zinc finger protein [Neobacillus ginsengisoli]MCM2535398.1 hypothetical protein [Neobacillus pocheonensis]MDQ0202306.1 CXXC-20-CXXC protein [Neobacillus ginsengisoli]